VASLRVIPAEAVLAEMRASDPPVQYLVGTPKGRLSRLENTVSPDKVNVSGTD
jgi:hypothetical protein